jgi:arylformamidase
VEFSIGKIEMVANTGTYIDSPFHRYENGVDLAGLELEQLADLRGIVVHARAGRAIGAELFAGLPLAGCAVLIHTGWDRHWRTDAYFENHPFLTETASRLLAESGAAMVGIDSFNIDDIADLNRPAHSLILGAGIPIVEHLRGLEQLPATGFHFSAVPVKVKGMGTFPVRAFARLDA